MKCVLRFIAVVLGVGCAVGAWSNEAVPLARGPVLGSPKPDSVAVWVQASVPRSVRVAAVEAGRDAPVLRSDWAALETEYRLMAILTLEGLRPRTTYRYWIETPSGLMWESEDATFITPPAEGEPTHVTMAAGSCGNHWIRYRPEVWKTIAKHHPDVFLALGDTPYADGLLWVEDDQLADAKERLLEEPDAALEALVEQLEAQYRLRADEALALAYERFREMPGFDAMAEETFWLATWDDHDTGMNNGDRADPVLSIATDWFKAFTPNPRFGTGEAGVYWRQTWGDVEIYFLDDQTWRTPTREARLDPEHATILGSTQFDWLVENLASSEATFKLILSGSPFNDASRKSDGWAGYPVERGRLIDAVAEHRVPGVVLVSGDVHRSEFFQLPWLEDQGGYPLYELVSSPLFQRARTCGEGVPYRHFCTGDPERGVIELWAWIEADTTVDDPLLILQVRDQKDEVLMDRHIRASTLRWPEAG